MLERVDVAPGPQLEDYASDARLLPAVRDLRTEAERLAPSLRDRTVWMINSTAVGGGVAEMLPRQVSLLRQLGVRVEWLVLSAKDARFFDLTKRIHNLIHDKGDPDLTASDRSLYESVNEPAASELAKRTSPGDIVVVHDPQPMGITATLPEAVHIARIWRCHIGLDERTPRTAAAWHFLHDYSAAYDRAVFSAPEYIPGFLAGRATIITPAIDPLSHKNRELDPHKQVGILVNGGLLSPGSHPMLTAPFPDPVRRLTADGAFRESATCEDIGLLFRPVVTQVSRWDKLKGWVPLLQGFAELKAKRSGVANSRHGRRLDLVRLVLAGPEKGAVRDDPESAEALSELVAVYRQLPPDVQRDVIVLALPMGSPKVNALLVNAIQCCSSIIVQASRREGFGLTATEGMWKRRPVLGTRAVGLRTQIRNGVDGCLIDDVDDVIEIAAKLDHMLEDNTRRDLWGRRAQLRVYEEFLLLSQLRRWLRLLSESASTRTRAA